MRKPPWMSAFEVTELPRGGKLVSLNGFALQIGAYPETIKDTMKLDEGVPQLFLAPESLFDIQQGVSAAELEFPVYFNFYSQGRKLRFLCRRHQLRPLCRVLRESVFGPSRLDLESEYSWGSQTPGFPDLQQEMAYYKEDPNRPQGRLRLRDMVEPLLFEDGRPLEVDGVEITALGGDRYRFRQGPEECEVVFRPLAEPVQEAVARRRFEPPLFGVTVIGSGHGFDPNSRTSGFILWIQGRGVLVDPPVNSTYWLSANGIDARLVEDVILTHCHADHDSGTLQKVLQEGRVTIHSTPTVIESFTRKYKGLVGLTQAEFSSLFNFHPLLIGQGINIAGGEFLFKYNLHPIPTLGFSVACLGKRFVYSCDTLFDPEIIGQLHERGILSSERRDDLLNFPWECDVIFHEAGVPPIHTPMASLAALPDDVKRRLWLNHVSQSAIPEGQGLWLARPGLENTHVLEVTPSEVSLAYRMLDALSRVDLFREFQVDRAAEFLRLAHYSEHSAGDVIIARDTPGDQFHLILAGEVKCVAATRVVKLSGRYDYFGEIAIFLGTPRTADVIARTPLELVSLSRSDFLSFIRGSDVARTLRRVAQNRLDNTWPLFSANRALAPLSPYQKTQLLALMQHRQTADQSVLYEAGQPVLHYYLVDEGQVDEGGRLVGRGAWLGPVGRLGERLFYHTSAVARGDGQVYQIRREAMDEWFSRNPGSHLRILRGLGV